MNDLYCIMFVEQFWDIVGEMILGFEFKNIDLLNDFVMDFIGKLLFFILLMSDVEGRFDVLFKGDEFGFVCVFDECILLIFDCLGNCFVYGYQNVFVNLCVGVIFIIFGMIEMLCING